MNIRKPIPLFYLFVFFIFHSCSKKHEIKNFFVETSHCYGTCPVFKMAFTQDHTAYYTANDFNKEKGSFKTILQQRDYDTLMSLLKATHFSQLKNKYAVAETDQPTVLLTIMYNENQIKKIEDYGEKGTKELEALYHFIFKLKDNQQWISTSAASEKKDSAIKRK